MQLVTTFDELNDVSKQKIHEKMHQWDKSIPRDVWTQLSASRLLCNGNEE